jgi:hypothetical protein
MSPELKIQESVLYEVWKDQKFKGDLQTQNGQKVVILNTGFMNRDMAGPDFKNARIKIDNLTYVGDIEIDRNYSDWIKHGHNIDNKYNSVILHLFMYSSGSQGYVYSRNGRKVPSICVAKNLDVQLINNSIDEDEYEKESTDRKLKCSGLTSNISNKYKEEFLTKLGVVRFQKKSQRIFNRLKELQFLSEMGVKEPVIGYDLSQKFLEREFNPSDFQSREIWKQLLYELIFEALGYSNNKLQMLGLAKAANIQVLKKIKNDENLVDRIEAVLLKISGLAQSRNVLTNKESIEYAQRVDMLWYSFKKNYDGEILDETIWHFFRIMPQNFPTVRIAGGARILKKLFYGELINQFIKAFYEINNPKNLLDYLRSAFVIKSEGFWREHYIFDQKANTELRYFVGASRANEILVNVLLPFFAVYFQLFNKPEIVKKIHKMYSKLYQKSGNKILTEVTESLGLKEMPKLTILSQGMIELFRNYCTKNKCLECEIGKLIFD